MYEMTRSVKCSNMCGDGEIRNSSVIDFLQDCSVRHLDNHPVLAPFFDEGNCVMYLVSRQVDILRKPKYNEKIHIKTWTYDCKQMYGFRNTIMFDENDKPCVLSYSTGVFMDLNNKRPMKIPEDVLSRIVLNPKFDMEFTSRKISIPKVNAVEYHSTTIKKHQLDMNNHTNNARYVDIADEYLPDNVTVKRIRCEYKVSAMYSDRIFPKVYTDNNIIAVDLCNDKGKSFAIIEYTI